MEIAIVIEPIESHTPERPGNLWGHYFASRAKCKSRETFTKDIRTSSEQKPASSVYCIKALSEPPRDTTTFEILFGTVRFGSRKNGKADSRILVGGNNHSFNPSAKIEMLRSLSNTSPWLLNQTRFQSLGGRYPIFKLKRWASS